MASFRLHGIVHALVFLLLFKKSICLEEYDTCNRKPLRTKTDPLPPDNRFALDIVGVQDKYIPNQPYKVLLYAKDNQSSFIAFTIAASGDQSPNDKNPLRPINLRPGSILSAVNSSDTIMKTECNNTVFEANVSPKTRVEALWIAPPKSQKCVTIYAYVAIKPDVWYSSDGPLSKRVCEDHRNSEDMKPRENTDCRVCDEARYEIRFEGTWSENTHQGMFPTKNPELARFSDIVGASHNKNFILYKDNSDATDGLKMLAEHGNTTSLEQEILKHLGTNVRTVIKATGPPTPLESTVASFRTSEQHHFISLASAIIPSPDWFLGVYNMELCDVETGRWAETVVLNLYPMDAGTDSGLTFESPNEVTSPPKVISKAKISPNVSYDQMKPFAKIKVNLIRTYTNPNCTPTETRIVPQNEDENEDNDDNKEPEEPEPSEPITSPPVEEPGIAGCPGTTTWEEWLPCEGTCEDKKVTGYHTRFRYFVVDGVEVGNKGEETIDVPETCMQLIPIIETEHCEESCEEQTESPKARSGSWKDWAKWK